MILMVDIGIRNPNDHHVSSDQYYDGVLEHETSLGGSISDLSLARNVLRLQ